MILLILISLVNQLSLYEAVNILVFDYSLLCQLQFLGEGGEAYGRHVFVEEAPPVVAEAFGVADGDVGAFVDGFVVGAAFRSLFLYEADELVVLLVEHAMVAFAQEGEGVFDEEGLEVDAELDVLFHGVEDFFREEGSESLASIIHVKIPTLQRG